MTEELTPKQRKVLNFVRKSIQKTGFPPTRTEIAKAFRYSSPNAAQEHLGIRARKGAIALPPSASRGIRLTEEPGLPLIGRVAAGSPILAEEHVERHCQVDPALFKPRADYLLKVRGMSMRDAGILDGDLIAVHRTHEARSGQIVVARLHDEVTVKRLQRRGHHADLASENPDFKPLVLDLWRAWSAPPHTPYAPALQAAGSDLAKLLFTKTRSPRETLWAIEQTLRSRACGAVLAWPDKTTYPELRRLQLAAEGNPGLAVLF